MILSVGYIREVKPMHVWEVTMGGGALTQHRTSRKLPLEDLFNSFLFLVVRPGAPSSVLAPRSKAIFDHSSFYVASLFLVATASSP